MHGQQVYDMYVYFLGYGGWVKGVLYLIPLGPGPAVDVQIPETVTCSVLSMPQYRDLQIVAEHGLNLLRANEELPLIWRQTHAYDVTVKFY